MVKSHSEECRSVSVCAKTPPIRQPQRTAATQQDLEVIGEKPDNLKPRGTLPGAETLEPSSGDDGQLGKKTRDASSTTIGPVLPEISEVEKLENLQRLKLRNSLPFSHLGLLVGKFDDEYLGEHWSWRAAIFEEGLFTPLSIGAVGVELDWRTSLFWGKTTYQEDAQGPAHCPRENSGSLRAIGPKIRRF
ncbi:hypothetical protein ACJJTC_019467 [Scirpophaga incertulas]